jgi:hydrolase, NUDIX family
LAGIEKKLMDKWIVKSSENLIDNNWVKVRRDDVELPNGEEIKDFYVVSLNEAVAIVAVDGNDNLILTKQYRHSYNKELIEIPAGAFEKNEKDGLSVAKRELREETGYVSDEWLYLGPTIESSSKLTNYLHLYFAKDCRKVGEQQLDATEELEAFLLPIETAVDMVMKNEICSNSSAHGILRVARMLKK